MSGVVRLLQSHGGTEKERGSAALHAANSVHSVFPFPMSALCGFVVSEREMKHRITGIPFKNVYNPFSNEGLGTEKRRGVRFFCLSHTPCQKPSSRQYFRPDTPRCLFGLCSEGVD